MALPWIRALPAGRAVPLDAGSRGRPRARRGPAAILDELRPCGVDARAPSALDRVRSRQLDDTTALPASTATPAGTTPCSRTRARRGTSARAVSRSAYCSTRSGSRRTCSRRCRTGSTCSPCRSSCAPPSAGIGRGWGSFAASLPDFSYDPPVVRRILEHLGRWQPEAMERSPPVPTENARPRSAATGGCAGEERD